MLLYLCRDDVVFARKDPEKNYELLKRITANADKVVATVAEWNTGQDILRYFKSLL